MPFKCFIMVFLTIIIYMLKYAVFRCTAFFWYREYKYIGKSKNGLKRQINAYFEYLHIFCILCGIIAYYAWGAVYKIDKVLTMTGGVCRLPYTPFRFDFDTFCIHPFTPSFATDIYVIRKTIITMI